MSDSTDHLTDEQYSQLSHTVAADIFRRDQHLIGKIIAQFDSAMDARLFAAIKREQGTDVTVTAGIEHMYAVRLVVQL